MLNVQKMAIAGDRPESGFRIELERSHDAGPPWEYQGFAVTREARFALGVHVSGDGSVRVDMAPNAPAALAETLRRLARVLWKHARLDGVAPPRRVVRWRADL
jgi:hypothetical protein